MRKAILVCGLGLVCLLLAIWGCERHTTGSSGAGGAGQVTNLAISAGDTMLATPAGVIDSTEITITVTDAGGNGVAGQEVTLWMDTNVGVLQSLSALDTTDYSGQVTTIFRVNANFGTNVINARVGGVTAEMGISVQEVNIAQITVQITPAVLNVAPGSSALCSLYVWVRDDMGNGVAHVKPSLQSSIGIIENYDRTDNSGSIRTNFYTAGDYGLAEIIGSVGNISDTVFVTVNQTASTTGSIELSSNVSFIYADGGVTTAEIYALLKDADYQIIRDAEVIFSSPVGSVMSPVSTDSLGIARTIFTDNNVATEPDSAMIIGRYVPYGIADTLYIMIHEQLPIDHIALDVTPNTLTAGVDSASVRATAFLTNGEFAPEGTGVLFFSDGGGTFSPESGTANLDNQGQAIVVYFAPNVTGTATLTAVISEDTSNTVLVTIEPGPVRNVDVSVFPSELLTNSNQTAVVTVDVTDSLGNHVGDGEFVALETSLGVVTPSAITTNGIAYGTLSPGNTAGAAIVKATVGLIADSTSVWFISGGPNSITLESDVNTIQVAQTGGDEQALLTATVNDALGNPVEDGTIVWFSIVDSPGGGININNHGIQDSSYTLNGAAIATLNSGVNSGPVLIKAWTYADTLQLVEIFALKSNINVASGPPATIMVTHNNVGEDALSGNWLIDVSAMVMDVYDNPVNDGWSVFFTVLPDTASIGAENVYTGNEPYGGGDPVPGVAFSWLVYPGLATFEEVTVTALCRPLGVDIIGEEIFELPLQECSVTLYITPAAWHYNSLGDPAVFECQTVVQEGHGLPVNNALCLFFTTKGRFYSAPPPGGVQIDEKYTGQPPDPPGQATLWIVGYMANVFLDPITPEVTGTVNCAVYGYPECFTDGQQIIFQRNP